MTKKATDSAQPASTKPSGEPTKKKKKKATTNAPPEFATYISRLHKAHQDATGDSRTISKDAIMAFEGLSDHIVHLLVENGKRVSRFTKSKTFTVDEAKAATTLALPGALRERAMKAGKMACDNYKATLPTKTPKTAKNA